MSISVLFEKKTFLQRVLILFFSMTLVSCEKDETLEDDGQPIKENQYVNDWILTNMQELYFWNTNLPSSTDNSLDPATYFSGLLDEDDRFSWIQEDYKELLNSLNGINKEAGFEFVLYRDGTSSENVIAQVVYTKPSSPAEKGGIKRGDAITGINGQTLTVSNYKDLIAELKENHSLTYKPIVVDENRFDAETTVSLPVVEYSENPNYLFKIIERDGRKIGYYVYNFFASGTESADDKYDTEMENVFAVFKAQGITDLVLDLRYNSGGSEISARNLASLIGVGTDHTKVFFLRNYNENVTQQIKNDPTLGDAYLQSHFVDKSSNIGGQLNGQRVYILTSSRTASASELVINGLKPYMDVFLIGDVTYGKNVGSISIYEENNARNTWGLQPIVLKVANSDGFSDYGDGFAPNVLNADNSLFIYSLGDERENLLNEAISRITGTIDPGRVKATGASLDILGHSLDTKRRSFSLIMEQRIGHK